jgi:flagellar protein FliS
MTNPYYSRAIDGASGVELVIALYDGIMRFLHGAIDAVDRNDVDERRRAVKRALDIIIHLQATLRMDVGGKPAEALSEFYAATFALILQASQASSRTKFLETINLVSNVRDAWREVARSTAMNDLPAPVMMAQQDEVGRVQSGMRWDA